MSLTMRTVLEQLREFDTASVANVVNFADPTPPEQWYMGGSIQSVTPSLGPSVGLAVTCEVDTSSPGGESQLAGYWEQVDQIRAMDVPAVYVVKTMGSRPDHECVLGDAMAKVLTSAGCVAAVTDGGVRDVPGLLNTGFAVYSRGTTVHHCAHRVLSINQPVEIGGITVCPGDIIHADAEGVITVPAGDLERLIECAVKWRDFECEVHIVWRRSDLTAQEKRQHVKAVFERYGFTEGELQI